MPHVCVDARLLQAAGIGTLLKAALTRLTRRGDYTLSLLCRTSDKPLLASFSSHLIDMNAPLYSLREQGAYLQSIPVCDLFWSPHFNVPLFPIRAKKRLTTICDVYHLAHFSYLTLAQKIYAKTMYNAAFAFSDHLTTLSEFSKQEIFRFSTCKPQKITIVPPGFDHLNPINLSFGLSSSDSEDFTQQILGFSVEVNGQGPFTRQKNTRDASKVPEAEEEKPKTQVIKKPNLDFAQKDYLLAVGNLKPHKNLVRLVQAYERLRPKMPLLIAGTKEGLKTYDRTLFTTVQNSPFLRERVHFLGKVSDTQLHALYVRAKLLIFPSTYEGFGYPPLEAMACGCPVVASHAAAIPEICEDAVEYVDPFCIDSIAMGIHTVLNDSGRQKHLIQKGEKLFEKRSAPHTKLEEVIDACCTCP
jgi:glycosyltransferase involved in cell wall biosynthesis